MNNSMWMKGLLILWGVAAVTLVWRKVKGKMPPVMFALTGGFVTALVSFGGNALVEVWQMALVQGLWEGTLVFLGLTLVYPLMQWLFRRKEPREEKLLPMEQVAKGQLKEMAESFRKLSGTFRELSEGKMTLGKEDMDAIFGDLSQRICRDCTNCSYCWSKNYYGTYQVALELVDTAWNKGMVAKQDVPVHFYNQCIQMESFLQETNRSLELARINLQWRNKLAENREAMASQLQEVANVMNQYADNMFRVECLESNQEQKLRRHLKRHHLVLENCIVKPWKDGRKEVALSLHTAGKRCVLTKDVAVMMEEVMGRKYRLVDGAKNVVSGENDMVRLVEDVNYKVITGIAKKTKTAEEISGDNYSVLYLDSGEIVLSLSDGMGAGARANLESRAAIELLEQFLDAGFSEKGALTLINSILVVKGEDQSCSTMDMAMVNLYTGMCQFVKIGAAASFLKRKKQVETMMANTLPMGILGEVDMEGSLRRLQEGDVIVMVTDGVLDALSAEDKEGYMEALIEQTSSANPSEMAADLLDSVLDQCRGQARDDMTILVAGLWKR